jgi:hypothetical protein
MVHDVTPEPGSLSCLTWDAETGRMCYVEVPTQRALILDYDLDTTCLRPARL